MQTIHPAKEREMESDACDGVSLFCGEHSSEGMNGLFQLQDHLKRVCRRKERESQFENNSEPKLILLLL